MYLGLRIQFRDGKRVSKSFKSVNLVISATLEILNNSGISVILVFSVIVDILDMIAAI